jgi:hypothetical protein
MLEAGIRDSEWGLLMLEAGIRDSEWGLLMLEVGKNKHFDRHLMKIA